MEDIKDRDEPYTDENGNRVVPASVLKDPVGSHKHITLADGTDIPTASCAISSGNGTLWIWVEKESGYNMVTLFPIFTDPTKTRRIVYELDEEVKPNIYEGYTELVNVLTDYSGKTSINLRYHPVEEAS